MKDPLPTPQQRNVVYHIPCSDYPNAYVGQTGRQFFTRVKKHKGAARLHDANSLLAIHSPTTGHAFDWDRASVIGKGTTKHTRDFTEAWNTTTTCVNQCVTLDPGYRALQDYGRQRRQGHPQICYIISTSARRAILLRPPPPVSNVYVYVTSVLPPVLTLLAFLPSYLYNPTPYIRTILEGTGHMLAKYGIRVAHKPTKTLRNQPMLAKDQLKDEEKPGVVYRVNCEESNSYYVKASDDKNARTQVCMIPTHTYGHIFLRLDTLSTSKRPRSQTKSKGSRLVQEAWLSGCRNVSNNQFSSRDLD